MLVRENYIVIFGVFLSQLIVTVMALSLSHVNESNLFHAVR